ncbi:MAG TPA: TolC family protein [Polyangiaceae bacterium]|nr:TolC family protein [Polyangiaceae bacterium]
MFSMPCLRLRRLAAVALNLALVSGCSTGRQGAPPGEPIETSGPPLRAAEVGAATPSSDERELEPGHVLERGAFVRQVLRNNPSLESARSGFRAALGRVRQAGTFEDPMVEIGVAPLSVGAGAPFGYEVAIFQKLPWFGKRGLEEAAASAEAEAARADYEAVRRELALTAVTLYDQYFVTTRSLAINEQHVALMQAMRAAAVAQFGTGRGSAQDAFQAEAELTHLEHDAVMLATARDVTVAQMNELLHRAPELPLPAPVAELPLPAAPDGSSGRLQGEAVERRPDIVSARERARAQEARGERAERDAYPDFTLSTGYNSMWEMPEHRFTVGVGFNVPLQSGRRGGAADEARAMRSQFESEAARLSDAARTQVFVALKQLEESGHVLALYEKRLLPVAEQQIDAARAGFSTAQNGFSAVIDAERNLRRVELDYQSVRADYGVRRAVLDRALGRIPTLDWKEGLP